MNGDFFYAAFLDELRKLGMTKEQFGKMYASFMEEMKGIKLSPFLVEGIRKNVAESGRSAVAPPPEVSAYRLTTKTFHKPPALRG